MLTSSGWTILVLKKMNLRWCPDSAEEPQVREEEGSYYKMLWAIPEDEEDSSNTAKQLIQLRKKERSPHKGRDCNCNNKNGLGMQQQVKPSFMSSIKQMRRNVRVAANSEIDSDIIKRTDDKYPVPVSLVPARKRVNEDELSYQCDEISQLYQAVSRGKLSLDNLRVLGLSLRI